MDPEQFGPYRILEPLGSGGMGQVYLAEDTRLGRRVALKVLPETADRVALERLLREARATAALQHPNIATLLDVGEGDVPYLVLERIDGETLHDRLLRGPLSWQQALEAGAQVASALGHAHGMGVLHRDIKPGNIMLSPTRGAVLLDFGLVQHFSKPGGASSESPTETFAALTRDGAVAGTAAYMSTEQLRGVQLDARSDLFQLGIVLYEAIAGKHPFLGSTLVDIQHAILHDRLPRLDEIAEVPVELARVVAKLLEKDPNFRYPDARALEVDLRALRRDSSSDALLVSGSADTVAVRSRRRMALIVAALAALGVIALIVWRVTAPDHAGISPPARILPLTHGDVDAGDPTFSPDGNSVAFFSRREGNRDLWIALVGGGAPVRITNTPEVESQPDWSPDGTRMTFSRRRGDGSGVDVLVMPALGGDARLLVERASDPAWSPDGRWIVFTDLSAGWTRIARVRVDGREKPLPVTELEDGYFHRNPAWTPDGKTIVYGRSPGGSAGQLWRVAGSGGTPRRITNDPEGTSNSGPVGTPDGRHVIHVSDRGGALNLWSIPIDGGRVGPITSGAGSDLTPSVTRDGRRIAFTRSPLDTRLVSYAEGSDPRILAAFGETMAWAPDLSPDGSLIAMSRKIPGSPWRPVIVPRAGGTPRTLLEGLPDVFWVRFLPDGSGLTFHTRSADGRRIGRVRLDGGGLEWLSAVADDAGYASVSPDGRRIACVRGSPAGDSVVLRSFAGGDERVVAENATLPNFSPDGRRLAIARSRSYTGGVGFVDTESGEVRWLTETGTWPVWTPDGREIAYADGGADGNQQAWLVRLDGSAPRRLGDFTWAGAHWPFVIDPAGGELITHDEALRPSTIWIAELD